MRYLREALEAAGTSMGLESIMHSLVLCQGGSLCERDMAFVTKREGDNEYQGDKSSVEK
jgi:hypothetical protein